MSNKVLVQEERFKYLIRLQCYVEQKLKYEAKGQTFKFMIKFANDNILETIEKLKKY